MLAPLSSFPGPGGSPACASRRTGMSSPFGRTAGSSSPPAASSGTRRWQGRFCAGPCTARCRRPTTPATGCAWRWPTARISRTWVRRGGFRSSGFRATRSTAGPAAAACGSSAPARGASSSTGPAGGSSTRPANTTRWPGRFTTSIGVAPGEAVPDWFSPSADLRELGAKTGIDPDGLTQTIEAWNRDVESGSDPEFGRGSSAYDGYWGDERATTPAGKTLGPVDTAPFHAVPVSVGAMGTKGGPRTDRDARVLHVSGRPIGGLYAVGNAMGGVTGRAYGGAGGTLGPAMVFGFRAGHAAATGKSVSEAGAD